MFLRSTPRSQGCFVGAVRRALHLVGPAVCLCSTTAGAEMPPNDDFATKTWVTDEGLPHNVVNRIRQDADGYLWLGSAAGLARYDGSEFETFPLPPALTQGGY